MILSTIKTYNTKPFQIHRIDVEAQQAIFPYKANKQKMLFIFSFMLFWIDSHIDLLFRLFDIDMHSYYLVVYTYRVILLFNLSK